MRPAPEQCVYVSVECDMELCGCRLRSYYQVKTAELSTREICCKFLAHSPNPDLLISPLKGNWSDEVSIYAGKCS